MTSSPDPDAIETSILAADVPPDARILLAVSGGADSVALLRGALAARAKERSWTLGVAHVNHTLRDSQSDEDEAFVRALAVKYDLPFWSTRVDTSAYAREHHLSLETAARELRYAFFRDTLYRWPGDVLMTGHSQDDQAETVLMRLLRGSGLRGLGGMRERSGTLVRPFLRVRRDEIIAYLQACGQGYRVDASNADNRHLRNRLRREIMPTLDLLQPRLVPVLSRTAHHLQTDWDFLGDQARLALDSMGAESADSEVSASLAVWRSLHPALQRATLILLLDRIAGHAAGVTGDHIEALAGALLDSRHGLRTPLPRGVSISYRDDSFVLSTGEHGTAPPLSAQRLSLPGTTQTEAGSFDATLVNLAAADVEHWLAVCGPLHGLCDGDAIVGNLLLTARRPGDRMRPVGSRGSRTLQDLFVDRKIPRESRDRVVVIRDDAGIVWIPGVALDQRVAVGPETMRILHIRWRPAAGV